MKGFVPTPEGVVDAMVGKLFSDGPPPPGSAVLDPGCGTGRFIEGIVRWCKRHNRPLPRVVGIDSDPQHLVEARQSFGHFPQVEILNEDFLTDRSEKFDYIVGNPPYVPITDIPDVERRYFRARYGTATGRFDLYLLFFEQSLRLLKPGGRLVFITPEKFLYVRTASPLRQALARIAVDEIQFLDEATFEHLTTYPVITAVVNFPASAQTRVRLRDGSTRETTLPTNGSSWLPAINGRIERAAEYRLSDACVRVSCGVATGADAVYVIKTAHLSPVLKRYAFPTVAGREISIENGSSASHSMLVPYTRSGKLLPEDQLGELGVYLGQDERRRRLLERTCVPHKPWYAFHETPPMPHILRPKILCKDITSEPFFMVDTSEEIIPRHSVYYIVPKDSDCIWELCAYLNSATAQTWLAAHCQRAANSFLRLQSHVLKNIPVPPSLIGGSQVAWCDGEAAAI